MFTGAAVCAVIAGVAALVLFRHAATRAISTGDLLRSAPVERAASLRKVTTSDFDDLLAANRDFAAHFALAGFDGARACGRRDRDLHGLAEIDPLGMGRARAAATPRSSATRGAG